MFVPLFDRFYGFLQARGPKKHLKRVAAPKHWMLDKLTGVFVSTVIFQLIKTMWFGAFVQSLERTFVPGGDRNHALKINVEVS